MPICPHCGKSFTAQEARAELEKRDAAIARDYESGCTMATIAARYDVGPTAVRGALKRTATVIRPKGLPCSRDVQPIIESYHRTMSTRETGREFGISGARVRQLLKKAGAKRFSKRHRHSVLRARRQEQAISLLNDGATPPEIARKIGVAVATVRKDFKEAGISVDVRRTLAPTTLEALRLFDAGQSLREIAGRLNAGEPTIRTMLHRQGRKFRDRAKKSGATGTPPSQTRNATLLR